MNEETQRSIYTSLPGTMFDEQGMSRRNNRLNSRQEIPRACSILKGKY